MDQGREAERWSEMQDLWDQTKNEIDQRLLDALAGIKDGGEGEDTKT